MKIASLILLFSAITCFAPPPGGSGGRRISSGNLIPPVPSTFPSGLTHYWTLDEASGSSRLDSIGGLSMSEVGGTVASSSGKHGNAADMRSVPTHYLQSGTESLTRPFSVAFWAYPHTVAFDHDMFLKDSSGSSGPYIIASLASGLEIGNNTDGALITASFGALDTWHLIVLVVASDGKYSASIDGAALSAGVSSSTTTVDLTTILGNGISGDALDGMLDEAMIFNRALSQSDVDTLWNGGSGTFL